MAKRPTITNISSGYASTTTLNDNFEQLRDAFDNTLSLDGSTPNAMNADLDLNGNGIANVGSLLVGGVDIIAVTKGYRDSASASAIAAGASETAAASSAAAAAASFASISPYTDEIQLLADDLRDGSFVAGDIYDFGSITSPTTGTSGSPDGFIVTVHNNLDNIETVADNETDINTVASISADVSSVAANAANIATVGGIASDVTSVASISADVTTVAGISTTDLASVAAIDTDVAALGPVAADVTTAAGISADITSVAGNATNINTVAGDTADINVLAPISADITTAAGISANITSVAGISADVTAVAADATDIGVVATDLAGSDTIGTVAADISDVGIVATDIANVNTVATNMADVNNFGETYRIGTTDPTTSLDVGDLFFNSTSGVLKVYDGVGWTAGVTAGSGFLALTGGTLTGTLTLDADPTTALGAATKQYVDTEVSNLVDSAPATLDTLNELAAALGDDDNFATTTATNLATKLPLAGGTMTGDITFNSTQLFDGRDVSADGAKLDAIATGATNYADADVDTHLNTSTATTGEYLQWDGTDYDWAAVPAGYADADVDTHLNTSTASTSEFLSWNGSDYDWATPTDTDTTYSAGTNLSLSGTTFNVSSSPTFSGTVTAVNFNTTSDKNLKENVETIKAPVETVQQLRGVTFDWIGNGASDLGVIAQEVEEVLPDLVKTSDDGFKSVKYSNMVGLLIEAVKDQQAQIDELKAKLGAQ